jgi:hypothetical protein
VTTASWARVRRARGSRVEETRTLALLWKMDRPELGRSADMRFFAIGRDRTCPLNSLPSDPPLSIAYHCAPVPLA